MFIENICIIGLGLMGGSMALGLKNKGFKGIITGYDKNIAYMEEAYKTLAIDRLSRSFEEATKDAELIIIAAPLLNYRTIMEKINIFSKKGVIVTDLGSAKSYPMELAGEILRKDIYFLGGHPMSGSERSGFKASNPFLYENAYYFLTPSRDSPDYIVEEIKSIIDFIGAYPVVVSAEEHDRIVSKISHLPHLIAMTLVNLMGEEDNADYLSFIGGGFRDTTRIASGNTKMWADICHTNRSEIIASIASFQKNLEEFKLSLVNGQDEKIQLALEMAKSIRDEIPNKSRGYITPLFELAMSVEDKPGVLAEITKIIGEKGINIKKIEIVNSRQEEAGALRIGFDSDENRSRAVKLLEAKGMEDIYLREEI